MEALRKMLSKICEKIWIDKITKLTLISKAFLNYIPINSNIPIIYNNSLTLYLSHKLSWSKAAENNSQETYK